MARSRRTIFNPAIWGPVLLGGFRLLFTRQAPWYCKALVIAAVVYAVMPFDFDFFPVVGWMDDVAVVLGLLSLALTWSPAGTVKDNPMEKPVVEPVDPVQAHRAEMDKRVVSVMQGPELAVDKDESGARGR